LARNGTAGHTLTVRTIARICERRLGTSTVHALRHTDVGILVCTVYRKASGWHRLGTLPRHRGAGRVPRGPESRVHSPPPPVRSLPSVPPTARAWSAAWALTGVAPLRSHTPRDAWWAMAAHTPRHGSTCPLQPSG